jgi:hypothetical protein
MKSLLTWLVLLAWPALGANPARGPLDPRGKRHLPIGIANTLDPLKTFVEAEGNFSPGFGSYGVYFWVWDAEVKRLFSPTMDGVPCEHGLRGNGHLIPWTQWQAGGAPVRTEVCEVKRASPTGDVFIVGARVRVTNPAQRPAKLALYVALRPLGAAGWDVNRLGFKERGDVLSVEGLPALIAEEPPTGCGAVASDSIGEWALQGGLPPEREVVSAGGDASGAMRFELRLQPGESRTIGLICPVLPGRRVLGHQWDGKSAWAQFDEARPNPTTGGLLQPNPGLEYYRQLKVEALFAEAEAYWADLAGRVKLQLPDPRWAESFAAIIGHSALAMNEGAPDVAVVNYNVFNRDGVYIANILQKAGQFDLAARALDYFIGHPFNGRVQPEADNPGQILWILGEHWQFTRDRRWLERVYPAARQIAGMIRYYRTTPGPHWVWDTSLDFGDALPPTQRKELKPGACDGFHPEYTEAFDIAGLRGAAALAEALGAPLEAVAWQTLAGEFLRAYDGRFGAQLAKGYGSYSALWPCRLYALDEGTAHEQFQGKGAQPPASWRYFPLATAHQGLLAGNRAAGWQTLQIHLGHEQMRGWYAFDEGGPSGVGGWNHVRTTWPRGKESTAMPHGWAMAEFFLLLRDSLVFESGGTLVLLAGVPEAWFKAPAGMKLANLPTHFGPCSLACARTKTGATLAATGARPPGGYVWRIPKELACTIKVDGQPKAREPNGDLRFGSQAQKVEVEFAD